MGSKDAMKRRTKMAASDDSHSPTGKPLTTRENGSLALESKTEGSNQKNSDVRKVVEVSDVVLEAGDDESGSSSECESESPIHAKCAYSFDEDSLAFDPWDADEAVCNPCR